MASPIGPGPLVFAHRGASIAAPDNSLEAFTAAVAAGADGIELDVRRSADGVLVLAHDAHHPTIGNFAEATYAEIVSAEPGITTLEEALRTIPRRVFVNVEIKHHRGEPGYDRRRTIVDDTLRLIREIDEPERIVVSSFDPFALSRARRLAPDILRGLLVPDGVSLRTAVMWARRAHHDAVNLHHRFLAEDAPSVVARVQDNGLATVVWTVDDPQEIARLFRAGVDVVITNDPQTARRVVDGL